MTMTDFGEFRRGEYGESGRTGYDTAQICMNGHVITGSVHDFPEFNKKFCDKCGQATITECPSCKTQIHGHYRGSMSVEKRPAPAYCHECGKSYPWTSASVEAAKALAEESELTADEQRQLESSIQDILADTPRTDLASIRIRRLLAKAGKEVGGALRKIVVDIASETAKKTILGP